MTSSVSGRGYGFTLIELLIVIAIIAILTALMFPVIFRAKEGARKVNCSSNVKQLAKAWLLYTQDYDESTPGGALTRYAAFPDGRSLDGKRYTVLWALKPYLKSEQPFLCPTQEGWNFHDTVAALDTHRPRKGSYTSNYMIMDRHFSAIERISDMIVFCDSYNPWMDCYANCSGCTNGCSSYIWDRIGRGYYQGNPQMKTDWHNGGINSVFSDGHAKWYALGSIYYSNWVPSLTENDAHFRRPITQDW
ncbi:MAG: prepilin-type N-terminal cleavage/methylation domain-containing protein [Fimbriimonadia bacterium]|nr:prepilin-type N-terminal cleavage/methylation domain-containing protein [Fimbriimonadia bacterium]